MVTVHPFILVPKLYYVMKIVVPKIASYWKEIAYSLHYDATRVKIIQEECKDDVEYCAFELFMYTGCNLMKDWNPKIGRR